MSPRRLLLGLCGLGILATLAVGLIELSSSPGSSPSSASANLTPAQMQARLAGSPAPLQALHAQANELLAGGSSAFRARLMSLHGTPVVINKWASWCVPCRSEFGAFQRASVNLGRKVAFIGIDSDSNHAEALAFLHSSPVSYPSYYDKSGHLGEAITDSPGLPVTAFYDRAGRQIYIRQGPYPSVTKLESDIRQYALDS